MSISTGTGDDGSSALIGGERLPKNHPRFQAYGTVDEAQSAIGMVRATAAIEGISDEVDGILRRVQTELFTVGSSLATSDPEMKVPRVTSGMIDGLDSDIKLFESSLPKLKRFILPAGNLAASTCFWARAVVRRAERHVAALLAAGEEVETSLVYLNRLGDLLFLIARGLNRDAGVEEEEWRS
jgi:cob(I)alamin adenosyltransferase